MEQPNAGVQPVEKAPELNPEAPTPNEPAPIVEEEKVLTKAEADELVRIAEEATALADKKAQEAENYKKGMLKAKGKLVENGLPEEDEPEVITREEAQRIADEAVQKALQEKAPDGDELAKANKTIAELKLTLNNRMQISPTANGSNLDKPEVRGNSVFSPEQEAELRARALRIGADPDEYIKEVAGNLNNPYGLKDVPTKRTQTL